MRGASAAASWKSWVTRSVGSRRRASRSPKLRAHARACVSVERGERLVEEEHGRVAREGSRERDALALAAGELARPRVAKRAIARRSSNSSTRCGPA